MMKFQVVSDSSCDLGRERAEKLGVTLVSYYVSMDGKNYYREERDITAQEFYRQMAENPGVFPRTSMPTIEDYLDAFRPIAARGEGCAVHLPQRALQRVHPVCPERPGGAAGGISPGAGPGAGLPAGHGAPGAAGHRGGPAAGRGLLPGGGGRNFGADQDNRTYFLYHK